MKTFRFSCSLSTFVALLLAFLCSSFPAHGALCTINSSTQDVEQGTIPYRWAGAGPEVLLLHGLFAQKEQWDEMLCALAQAGYRASAPDLPGYAQSTGYGLEVYALEQQVALLDKFMQARGVLRFHLAGNSMGGAIAAMYAGQHPGKVMSLAFIGAPLGIGEWGAAVKQAIFKGINPFIPATEDELDLELSLLLQQVPTLTAESKSALLRPYIDNAKHFQQVWNIVNLYTHVLTTMKPSRVRTLILWGQSDQIFAVAGARALARKYPHSHQLLMQGVGHLPMLDAPAAVATHYVAFLSRARQRSAAAPP